MDLTTTYLGLELPHPFMPGASPLVDDLDTVRRLEDAGAAAIVMHSLFEEQIVARADRHVPPHRRATASRSPRRSATSPSPSAFALGPEEYLEQIGAHQGGGGGAGDRVAQRHHAPAAGSTTRSSIEQAGADALELNVYSLATDPTRAARRSRTRTVEHGATRSSGGARSRWR